MQDRQPGINLQTLQLTVCLFIGFSALNALKHFPKIMGYEEQDGSIITDFVVFLFVMGMVRVGLIPSQMNTRTLQRSNAELDEAKLRNTELEQQHVEREAKYNELHQRYSALYTKLHKVQWHGPSLTQMNAAINEKSLFEILQEIKFDSDQIPEQYICPINQVIMDNPVALSSGRVVDYSIATRIADSKEQTCFITKLKVRSAIYLYELREEIHNFVKQKVKEYENEHLQFVASSSPHFYKRGSLGSSFAYLKRCVAECKSPESYIKEIHQIESGRISLRQGLKGLIEMAKQSPATQNIADAAISCQKYVIGKECFDDVVNKNEAPKPTMKLG